MQTGEVLRRVVFNLLDAAKGGKLKKLKEVNKRDRRRCDAGIYGAEDRSASGLCKKAFSVL